MPIVAVTANALPEQTADARRAGMVDIIHKPFSADQIYAVLARVLGGRVAAAEEPGEGTIEAAAEPLFAKQVAHLTCVPDISVSDASKPDILMSAEPIREAKGPSVNMPVLGKLAGLIGDAKVKDLLAKPRRLARHPASKRSPTRPTRAPS